MAGHIPKEFIDQLLGRIDIVDVVNKRVPLKKAGREYTACCPFHNEKTPSFTVSPIKQFFHCFGCGEHGDVISFVMKHDNLSFMDTVELLAADAGMQVPKPTPQQAAKAKQEKDLYALMDQNLDINKVDKYQLEDLDFLTSFETSKVNNGEARKIDE